MLEFKHVFPSYETKTFSGIFHDESITTLADLLLRSQPANLERHSIECDAHVELSGAFAPDFKVSEVG